jgi:transcriptional regulator with XRE-family HTH domain
MGDKNCTRLRVLMAKHRLTAEQVGAMVNREAGTVYQWRRGYRAMPDELLELLECKLRPLDLDGEVSA